MSTQKKQTLGEFFAKLSDEIKNAPAEGVVIIWGLKVKGDSLREINIMRNIPIEELHHPIEELHHLCKYILEDISTPETSL